MDAEAGGTPSISKKNVALLPKWRRDMKKMRRVGSHAKARLYACSYANALNMKREIERKKIKIANLIAN